MPQILFNKALSDDFYLMKVALHDTVKMGQFYMLRGWNNYPLLSRPISIYDADGEGVTFLYRVVGEGTGLLAKLQEGDEITCAGPYGNGYPMKTGKIALVGGGVGIAPLYLVAKRLKENDPATQVDCFLGFSGRAILEEEFAAVCDRLKVNLGGFVTDDIEPGDYDVVFTCGPKIMMRVLFDKVKNTRAEYYVSMESRMGCGIGACLVCSCKTGSGNKKVCKDGPVFAGEEVFGL